MLIDKTLVPVAFGGTNWQEGKTGEKAFQTKPEAVVTVGDVTNFDIHEPSPSPPGSTQTHAAPTAQSCAGWKPTPPMRSLGSVPGRQQDRRDLVCRWEDSAVKVVANEQLRHERIGRASQWCMTARERPADYSCTSTASNEKIAVSWLMFWVNGRCN